MLLVSKKLVRASIIDEHCKQLLGGKMRLNQKLNTTKVLGLALCLASSFSLYTATSALAESESGGFIMVGIGGESGGVFNAGRCFA